MSSKKIQYVMAKIDMPIEVTNQEEYRVMEERMQMYIGPCTELPPENNNASFPIVQSIQYLLGKVIPAPVTETETDDHHDNNNQNNQNNPVKDIEVQTTEIESSDQDDNYSNPVQYEEETIAMDNIKPTTTPEIFITDLLKSHTKQKSSQRVTFRKKPFQGSLTRKVHDREYISDLDSCN